MNRHRALGRYSLLLVFLSAVVLVVPACSSTATAPGDSAAESDDAPCPDTPATPPMSLYLPQDGKWAFPKDTPTGRTPSCEGILEIEGLGTFTFDPAEIKTVRPDIFAAGHFSLFDVLVHLADKGWYTLDYHYEECLDTYVIENLNGQMNWWYRAKYAGGWYEVNAYRMDMYPYKDGTSIRMRRHAEEYVGRLYNSFAEEIMRKSLNQGRTVIPEVRIGSVVYQDVPISAHDARTDMLQPGTITALDVLLSLGDQKKINQVKLTWYGSLGEADPMDSFLVEQIDDGDGLFDRESSPSTGGWVYEIGSLDFPGFQGSHIHIPSDVRTIVSPEYMTWYWLG
jgi:hypothetical protein